MFIRKSKHDAAIAAKDAEIADARERQNKWFFEWQSANAAVVSRDHTIADLRAKLVCYTAPRERGEGGRFLPLKRVQA